MDRTNQFKELGFRNPEFQHVAVTVDKNKIVFENSGPFWTIQHSFFWNFWRKNYLPVFKFVDRPAGNIYLCKSAEAARPRWSTFSISILSIRPCGCKGRKRMATLINLAISSVFENTRYYNKMLLREGYGINFIASYEMRWFSCKN